MNKTANIFHEMIKGYILGLVQTLPLNIKKFNFDFRNWNRMFDLGSLKGVLDRECKNIHKKKLQANSVGQSQLRATQANAVVADDDGPKFRFTM